MEDIHDIKGLVPLPHGWQWLWALLILAVVLALAYWLWKRWHPTEARPAIPPLTPYELAIRELQRLREENPSSRGILHTALGHCPSLPRRPIPLTRA